MSRLFCEVCTVNPLHPEYNCPVAQISAVTDLSLLNVNEPQRIPKLCKINVPSHVTDKDFYTVLGSPLAPQHLTYEMEAEVLLQYSVTD